MSTEHPDRHAVFDPDGVEQGWAIGSTEAFLVATAISLRSLVDLEVRNALDEVVGRIGREPLPPEPQTAPFAMTTDVDPDEQLLVHVEASKPGASVDWGDGTGGTITGLEAQHTYSEASSYHIIAQLDDERGESWVTLVTPPTIPEEEA